MSYKQLTQEQRYHIWALKKAGFNRTDMAKELGVHKSTISRELRRNTGQRGYRAKQAHSMAITRQQTRARTTRIAAATWILVETHLRQEWSPEQVSGWLQRQHQLHLSHERIYQYVYEDKQAGGTLYKHLRCQKQRRKRGCLLGSAAMTGAVNWPTAVASVSDLPLWGNAAAWAIGRPIPLWVKAISKPSCP
jgi:IS30 family transposase